MHNNVVELNCQQSQLASQQHNTDTIEYKSRMFLSRFGIAIGYILYSLLFDLVLFVNNGWEFASNYWVSVFLLIVVAGLINIIGSNMIKMIIFGLLLGFDMFFVMCNIVSYDTLGETFGLELFGKIIFSLQQNKLVDFGAVGRLILVGVFYCLFWACAICINKLSVAVDTSPRSGITKQLMVKIASLLAVVIAIPCIGGLLNSGERASGYVLEDLYNSRVLNQQFDANRVGFYQEYGTVAFIARNLLSMLDWQIFDNELSQVMLERKIDEYDKNNQEDTFTYNLGTDYNLMMLMMETVEYDAINPILTPNLWWIKEHSAWVDNYYAVQRTTVTENISLTGSNPFGFDVSYMYGGTYLPQSLPNIFDRMGYQAVDAYHNYDDSVYGRDNFFARDHIGFHNFYYYISEDDPAFCGDLRLESDYTLFERGLSEQGMAPCDKTFFNYVLNVGTHGSHFGSSRIIPNGLDDQGRPTYLPAAAHVQQDLDWVLANQDTLNLFYPRMYDNNDTNYAIIAWMSALRDYDNGVGLLLDHLRTTPDLARYPDGSVPLIATTALVVYSDHNSYLTNNDRLNNNRGGLLNRRQDPTNLVNGERLGLMVYNPRDRRTLLNAGNRYINDHVITLDNIYDKIGQGHLDLDNLDYELEYSIGRKIHRFASNADIYKTVCQLFGISTSLRYTLGNSILSDSQTVGINYSNTTYFLAYQVDDIVHVSNTFNNLYEITDADIRYKVTNYLERNVYTILYLLRLYKTNSFGETNIESLYMMNAPNYIEVYKPYEIN